MQCFSTFFGSWPLCYFFTPCDPFLLFFHCIWYYNHYDYNKVLLWKNATNYHNIFTIKMHFITSNFKRQLNFTNIFNATVDFATVWPTSNIRGWVLDSANLLSCSTTLWFRASVLMWTGAEKNTFAEIYCGTENIIRKASSDRCRYDSRTAHQNRENGISWKLSRADESFPRSQNWSCTSSGILANGYSQRGREQISYTCIFFFFELREILLELNFNTLKVVYRCLQILSKFFSFFNNTWQFLKQSHVRCITSRNRFCNFE